MRQIDITGKKYNRLIAIRYAGHQGTHPRWLFKCDCGNKKIIVKYAVVNNIVRSCGCLLIEKRAENNKLKTLGNGVSSFNKLYNSYKKRGERDLGFSISKEEFKKITKLNCYYCNKPPSTECKTSSNTGAYLYNGLDRVDNNRGYDLDNVVPCCSICNFSKRNNTKDEFLDWVISVYKFCLKKGLINV